MHHWRIAYASAKEVDTHLRLLMGSGAIDKVQAGTAIQLFDEVRALTWRLLHPKPQRDTKNTAQRGVPDPLLCRNDLPATPYLAHKTRTGQPTAKVP